MQPHGFQPQVRYVHFCSNLQHGLNPIKNHRDIYIVDAGAHSKIWLKHLQDNEQFLQVMRVSVITLKFKKSQSAMPEIKLCGQSVGSGSIRADPD